MRLGITSWSLGVSGPSALYAAAELGFAAIHIDAGGAKGNPPLQDPAVRAAYRQAVADTGMCISGIGVNILNDYGLASPAGSVRARQCWEAITQAIDAAAELGVGTIFLPSFRLSEIRDQAALQRTAEVIRAGCRYAEGAPVQLATENPLSPAALLRLIHTVDHPQMRVLIDTLNPVLWEQRVEDIIAQATPWLCAQIHLKDGSDGHMGNAALGRGQADLLAVARALAQIGFRGLFVLENIYAGALRENLGHDIGFAHDLFGPFAE